MTTMRELLSDTDRALAPEPCRVTVAGLRAAHRRYRLRQAVGVAIAILFVLVLGTIASGGSRDPAPDGVALAQLQQEIAALTRTVADIRTGWDRSQRSTRALERARERKAIVDLLWAEDCGSETDLERVVARYPTTIAAQRARRRLRELQKGK